MSLRDFLEGRAAESQGGHRFEQRCSICRNPDLAAEVKEYAEGVLDGSIHFTLWKIWKSYFQPVHRVGSPETLRRHITMHLGIDLP